MRVGNGEADESDRCGGVPHRRWRGDLQHRGIKGEVRGTKNWWETWPGRHSPVRQRSWQRQLQSRRHRHGSGGRLHTRSQGGEEVLATRKGKKWRWGKRAGSDALDAFKATRWGSIGGGLVWGTRWMRRRGVWQRGTQWRRGLGRR
jgi:hypothetical protein